jgi:tRNA (guanine-N7-)-methyltransferase
MSFSGRHQRPFREKVHALPARSEINPYVKIHEQFGEPVITANEALDQVGRWAECFGREAPLHLEIGSGNGFFLAGMAGRHPEQNWLGIEIRFKRVVLCARKIQAAGLQNARIARYDAWWLDDLFGPGSLAGLYVNHPDPWTKKNQADKRLMGRYFAEFAAWVLAPGASLRLKSDFPGNLDGLMSGIEGLPLRVVGRSGDVRMGLPWDPSDDVTTNYQSKFDRRDAPVHALCLVREPGVVERPSALRQPPGGGEGLAPSEGGTTD